MTQMNTTTSASKPFILVLDDDPIMLLFLQEYLQDDFKVKAFSNGQDAVNWLRLGRSVGAMLVDLNMPKMDGLAFLEATRNFRQTDSTPLLILSGSSKSADRVAGLRAGAVDFISKPFNPDELLARLAIHVVSKPRPLLKPQPVRSLRLNPQNAA
jgi:DNA-binding response OmpR family regulator